MKARLSILYFLQFGVWGCYLTSLSQFLGSVGLGARIAWFYAAIGLVSIVTPSLFGHLADRYIRPARLLSICHLTAALAMFGAFAYTTFAETTEFPVFYTFYIIFLAFYMPTMALANTASFGILKSRGIKPVDAFPSIRIWGTIGFIAAMWWVNCTYFHDGRLGWTVSDSHPMGMLRFQYNGGQLFCSAAMALLTAAYALSLPFYEVRRAGEKTPSVFRGIGGFFRLPALRVFLVFAALTGVCLQISNGFATPYITHFIGLAEYSGTFAAGNATMLFSISQIAEAVLILAVGVALKKTGIRGVFAIGIAAWCLRFLLLGLGNPGDGLWMLILSMVVYGVAFNFITIAGHLYVDGCSPERSKGLGQGAMMLMSNGVGATLGVLFAGDIINRWCRWETVGLPSGISVPLFMGEWLWPWLIFAAYTAVIAVAWIFLSPRSKR